MGLSIRRFSRLSLSNNVLGWMTSNRRTSNVTTLNWNTSGKFTNLELNDFEL